MADMEDERRARIRTLLAAAAYEICDRPIITDAEFDQLALRIDVSVDTDRPDLDAWFRKEFSPSTGSWIRTFPELAGIMHILDRVFGVVDRN